MASTDPLIVLARTIDPIMRSTTKAMEAEVESVEASAGEKLGRARFAAYVFFTALALRLAATGVWALAVYPVIAVGFMQTAAARRLWPPIAPGWRREPGDRMRRS